MAELIITDAQGVDRESVADYKLDSAWGSDENDFELTVSGRLIESGSYVYLDGGECGGVVDALKDSLKRGESTLTYSGRTWHGMLANKILAPDSGKDYLTVSGSASSVIGSLISRVGLDAVFEAVDSLLRRADHQKLPVRPLRGCVYRFAEDVRSQRTETQARLCVRSGQHLGGTHRALRRLD